MWLLVELIAESCVLGMGEKAARFSRKTPVDQCDSIRWAAFNNLFRAISARTMNLCASVTPHLFSDLI